LGSDILRLDIFLRYEDNVMTIWRITIFLRYDNTFENGIPLMR